MHQTEPPRRLRVAGKTLVATDVVELVLSATDGSKLESWKPGAHIILHLPGGLDRQYSLCGPDRDAGTWTIAVHAAPDSRGGSRLIHDQLKTGDTIPVSGPRNNFPMQEHERYVFIAGGIGVTPILAMVREVRERPGADFTFLYCGRSRSMMAYHEDISAWPDTRVIFHADDERGGPPDLSGFLAGHTGAAIYCCGPQALISAVTNKAPDSSIIRVEHFSASRAGTPNDTEFDVVVSGSDQRVRVAKHESILDALARAGFDVPSSCREGICGTCETAVVSGIPDHRDLVLTEEEHAEGALIMPCVSRSRTAEIELDLF